MQFWMLCLFETILLFFLEIPWERFSFYLLDLRTDCDLI